MKQTGRIIATTLMSGLLFCLLGCGVGLNDSTGPSKDRATKNDKLHQEYDPLQGVYQGKMNVPSLGRSMGVKLYLYVSQVQEGTDPGNLKPGVRVVLNGRLVQTTTLGDSDNLIMEGQYDSDTGELLLDPADDAGASATNANGCQLGQQEPISLKGVIHGDVIRAKVEKNSQIWGQLSVTRIPGEDVSKGTVLDEEKNNQRLQAFYQPIVGTYQGQLSRDICSTERSENFTFYVYTQMVQTGTSSSGLPCYTPKLRARWLREYEGELPDVSFAGDNRYDPDLHQVHLQTGAVDVVVGVNPVTHVLTGEINSRGDWGQFEAQKTSDKVQSPSNESELLRQRLSHTYTRFIGSYKGTNQPYEKTKKPWPVNLDIYQVDIVDQNGNLVPQLMAHYSRPDFSDIDPNIGSRLMHVDLKFDACKPMLAMRSDPTGTGDVPGQGLMVYPATFDSGVLTGPLSDNLGPRGTLTVKRVSE